MLGLMRITYVHQMRRARISSWKKNAPIVPSIAPGTLGIWCRVHFVEACTGAVTGNEG